MRLLDRVGHHTPDRCCYMGMDWVLIATTTNNDDNNGGYDDEDSGDDGVESGNEQ